MPLLGLKSHGPDNTYLEPSYPYVQLEDYIPVPGATYNCATAQRRYFYHYIYCMRHVLPRSSALGARNMRDTQTGPAHSGTTIEYSRATLESCAIESDRLAMEAVKVSIGYVPVMGFTHRNMTEFQTSSSNTEVFDTSGIIYEEAEDCDGQYCQDIHSKQRFPGPAS